MKHTRENFLSHGFNKRFVEALEFLKYKANSPVPYKEVLDQLGLKTASYDHIKKGTRSFPATIDKSKVAFVLNEYGIRPEWLLHGSGEMQPEKYLVIDEPWYMELIRILRNELKLKDKYVEQLEEKIKQLGSLGEKVGHEVGHKSGLN